MEIKTKFRLMKSTSILLLIMGAQSLLSGMILGFIFWGGLGIFAWKRAEKVKKDRKKD